MSERIPARIKNNVMILPSKGGVSEFLKDKRGLVRPDITYNSFGSPCYVWAEPWHDGMGGSGSDIYYVPAFAVELLKQNADDVG